MTVELLNSLKDERPSRLQPILSQEIKLLGVLRKYSASIVKPVTRFSNEVITGLDDAHRRYPLPLEQKKIICCIAAISILGTATIYGIEEAAKMAAFTIFVGGAYRLTPVLPLLRKAYIVFREERRPQQRPKTKRLELDATLD